MKIAVDAMGGDHGPAPVIEGAMQAAQELGVGVILVGKEDELTACRPYLDRQIALIKPKVICILGRTAYSSLLGGSSITANRGKIVERAGQRYFLTFHPAAVIYNKGLLSALEADLKKLVVEINKEEEREASLEDYL